jgi:uncharacterized protein YjbI with pentapeptide repeats
MVGGPKVFISYERDHEPTAALVAELLRRDIHVLRDVDIEAGERWSDELWRWLLECSGAVAVVSKGAARSDWCRREWSVLAARASAAGLRVVPVHVEPPGPDANMLDHLQAVVVENGDVVAAVDAVVERLQGLHETPPSPADYLAAHQAWLTWQFAEAPALGREPFSLADAYIDTECGSLTWDELSADRRLDPFAEKNGGRVDLVDAVLDRFGDPDFRDLVVVQGPAGSGKSAFSLRLASRLVDEGLTPVLVRFRDLRLSTYPTVDELLQDAVRVAPTGEHPPAPTESLFGPDQLGPTVRLGDADICRTLLILDGWDEVALTGSVRFKQQIDEWLPRLRERFVRTAGPPVRVLLTGRPSAVIDRSSVLRRETAVLTVRPMQPEQLRTYAVGIAGHLDADDNGDWRLDLDRCEQAFARYENWFERKTGDVDVLGFPLLALLAFRTIAGWEGSIDELFAQPTALYSALIDITAEHAGKAEPGPQGTVHRGGPTLRRLLQRVAAIITAQGTESVSFDELDRRLEDDAALRAWAQQAAGDSTLHELVVNFYFKGHAELGCEFLHKSFREYLFAEAVVAVLEEASQKQSGPQVPPAREWGEDFAPGSVHHDVSRSLASLLGPQWLTPEVQGHLFWLVERAAEDEDEHPRWVWIRDLLNDVWGWWGEGVHLRAHPERRKGRDERLAPPIVEMLDEATPVDGRAWTYSPSSATIDAHLGDALLQLTAFVHALTPDPDMAGRRDCQIRQRGAVRFRPFEFDDAQSLLGRMAGARRRPGGLGLSDAWLTAVDLSGQDLSGATLIGADLSGAHLAGLRAAWVTANGADFSGADLDQATLDQGRLRGADLRSASLVDADLVEALLVDAKLAGANLNRAEIGGADLTGADLTGAHLAEANLTGANVTGAHLAGADLTRANLTGANLTGANLTGANLTGANLTSANLTSANLTGADLSWARLADVHVDGVKLDGANLIGTGLTPAGDEGASPGW